MRFLLPISVASRLVHYCLVGALLSLSLGLGSCGSTGGTSSKPWAAVTTEDAVTISVRDYRSQIHFTLTNIGEDTRLAAYSSEHFDAGTKIQSAEVLGIVLGRFDEHGLGICLQQGAAIPGSGVSKTIQITGPNGVWHASRGRHSSKEQAQAFETCVSDFIAVYQATPGMQSVINQGDLEFEQPKISNKRRN